MTSLPEPHGPARERVYRVAKVRRDGRSARQYRHTLVLSEDSDVAELGHVDVIGKPTLLGACIRDANGAEWHLTPNRKVMPSQWTLSNDLGMAVLRIDGMIGGKLLNPMHRTSVAVFDATGMEQFRITDIRPGVADRILGPGPGDWTAMRDDVEVGGIVTLPSLNPPRGIRQRLVRLLSEADRGVYSIGTEHLLPPVHTLAMLVIHDDLTQVAT